jgi:hypothetical protein
MVVPSQVVSDFPAHCVKWWWVGGHGGLCAGGAGSVCWRERKCVCVCVCVCVCLAGLGERQCGTRVWQWRGSGAAWDSEWVRRSLAVVEHTLEYGCECVCALVCVCVRVDDGAPSVGAYSEERLCARSVWSRGGTGLRSFEALSREHDE